MNSIKSKTTTVQCHQSSWIATTSAAGTAVSKLTSMVWSVDTAVGCINEEPIVFFGALRSYMLLTY